MIRPVALTEVSVPDDPYRLSVTRSGGLEVVARLRTLGEAEELIDAINTWKVLLKRADEIKSPSDK